MVNLQNKHWMTRKLLSKIDTEDKTNKLEHSLNGQKFSPPL